MLRVRRFVSAWTVCGSLFTTGVPAGQDPTFLLATEDPSYEIPGHLGNGVFSVVTTPLGTTPARSYMIGVYDHGDGDVPRIAVLPAWNEVDLFNGSTWLNDARPGEKTVRSYRQTIDLYDGALRTRYEWIDGGRRTTIGVEAFVSRSDPHLAGVRLRVVPHYRGKVTVALTLRPWGAPKRLALGKLEKTDPRWTLDDLWYPGHMIITDRRIESASPFPAATLVAETEGRGTVVAEAMTVAWSQNVARPAIRPLNSAERVGFEVTFDASPGSEYVFDKLVGVASSWGTDEPRETARTAARTAAAAGYEAVFAEHAAAWHRLWETDIVLEGAPELQRVVRSMIFYLLGSVGAGTDFSIPPMGLSSAGYYGHIFWDADTYMFPPLLVMHPEIARSMVMFRYRTLDAAKAKARQYGYDGAMYPWEADERGEETTPKFAEQNALMEIHIVGDVALAQWQYFLATGDTAYLAQYGYPVIRATADFWVSRVCYNRERDRYETDRLVSVHEGLIGIANDTYTNAIAKLNLEIAIRASDILGREPDPDWKRVAEKMYIPFDERRQVHPTYEDAPEETLGDVVPLLSYPLAMPMSEEAKRNNLRHAVRRFEERGGGAMMGSIFYPLLAAELGDRELFNRLVPKTYEPWLRGPFLALSETPRNDAVNFVTGAGAFLQQVIFGYTGLRLGVDGLEERFDPMLPPGVDRLVLKNVWVRSRRYDIRVEDGRLEFVKRQPPFLEFPDPELDDTAAYEGYTTRFFRDSEENAYQVYLKRRDGRVVHVWANAANESVGFTVRDTAGRPAVVDWGSPTAEVAASDGTRSVAYALRFADPAVDVGLFLLGSMRLERDFQYLERHLARFDSPPFIPEELPQLIAHVERLPAAERAQHLAALSASSAEELRDRLEPQVSPFGRDTLQGVRVEQASFDGENRLVLELGVDSRRATLELLDGRIRARSAGGEPLNLFVRTTTDAPALRSLTREEIFNTSFLAAYARARAEHDSLRRLPEAGTPGTPEHDRILRFRRLERQVRGLELLSYEEKLMAGLPNFATYFGRDMFMTALLMEPIWRPEMLEHVVASALRKLSPTGEVSHEEALGGQAIRENAAEYNRVLSAYRASPEGAPERDSLLARARAILENLQETRENYRMRDDDFQLPVVAARYLAHPDVPPARKRSFLVEAAGEARPTRLVLLLRNLAYVARASAAYANQPEAVNLVGFPELADGRWFPGSWRDSGAGYANGRFAMDINVVWVPNALESMRRILGVLSDLGFGRDAIAGAVPEPEGSRLASYIRDGRRLERAVRAWRRTARHFRVALAPAEIRERVSAKLDWFPEPYGGYWRRMLEQTGAGRDSLRFLALSLDAEGQPIPVANTDPSTALFLEDYTGQLLRDEIRTSDMETLIEVFLRPYPVGLFVEGLGPLAANDAYASRGVWEAFWKDDYHSPRVVWGREVNLLLAGLTRQLLGALDARGWPKRLELEPYVRLLRRALERTREAVNASGLQHHELWSYRIEDGTLRPVRYGTSSDVQLWNLTDLAVQHLLAQIPES